MKKYLYMIVLLMALTSCKKFLDVKPESQIDKNELFTTEEGFKEALNGIYTLCASPKLYGGNLTFSNLDILAQNYQFSDAGYQKVANFNYAFIDVVDKNNEIWSSAYRAIANCNNILAVIDEKKGILTSKNHDLIKGEALALRAYLHFDLLRMFAPSFKSSPTARAIPYVTTVTTTSTPFSTVTEVLDKTLLDLNEAKVLLRTSDPILSLDYSVGYPGDDNNPEVNTPDLFLQNRRHRLNYLAVTGELARVYLYKNDMANALLNAELIMLTNKFPWTNSADFLETDVTKKDRIFYKELLACWAIPKERQSLIDLFTKDNPAYSPTLPQIEEIYEKAEVGADDLRFKQWFIERTALSGPRRAILQKYLSNVSPIPNRHPLVAPALRLSEIYYIAAEASFDTDPAIAMEYFNIVRRNRGIGADVTNVTDKQEFIELLITEARKEFYGESQLFYMYKRLNHAVRISATQATPPSDKVFVFPLPVDEEAYRNN